MSNDATMREILLAIGSLQGDIRRVLANHEDLAKRLDDHNRRIGTLEIDKAKRDGRSALVAAITATAITFLSRAIPFQNLF